MSPEHQRLQRQDNRLQTKDQRVNEGCRIDHVQIELFNVPISFDLSLIVVRIEICDAVLPGGTSSSTPL